MPEALLLAVSGGVSWDSSGEDAGRSGWYHGMIDHMAFRQKVLPRRAVVLAKLW